MKAHAEVIAAVIRIGTETDQYGKPFEFACAVSGNGTHATVKALMNPDSSKFKFRSDHRRAIARELARLGFTSFGFDRMADEGVAKREIEGRLDAKGNVRDFEFNQPEEHGYGLFDGPDQARGRFDAGSDHLPRLQFLPA
ncbi:MAG TPA: hypothetical protein VKV77_09755 [Methylovirgula sp.]|nr:hypothetical protein [Methylovirgula sp.]